jgi:hypothetical protein
MFNGGQTMTEKTDIRTRPDGSIDTAYYMARGRMLRSRQAHRRWGSIRLNRAARHGAADGFQD